MHIEHLFLGKPQNKKWLGQEFSTSIFRKPVEFIEVQEHRLLDNEQGDYKYHGGKFKELYSYALEDYGYWKDKLGAQLEIGMMGENITTVGLNEEHLCVGERLQFGETVLEVVQPRIPCLKLNIRLGRKDAIKLFLDSEKYGVYYKVIENGRMRSKDAIISLGRDASLPSIKLSELVPVLMGRKVTSDLKERILSLPEMDLRVLSKIKR